MLNAGNDEVEAAIIAQAGQRGAVTISTNMAERGTDICLGDEVAWLGGLYVIGTNRHESRRIDNQLRGRAGCQGDPGCSRFFISLEDPLMIKYGDLNPRNRNDPESMQRLVEGQHLDKREFLLRYDLPVEVSGIRSTPTVKQCSMAQLHAETISSERSHYSSSTIFGPTILPG